MPTPASLKLRGNDSLLTDNTSVLYYEDNDADTTVLFPKWWGKNGKNREYIRVNRIHVSRDGGDLDLIVPADYDLMLTANYDGDKTFNVTHHRSIKRMGLAPHGTTDVRAEFIYPTSSKQKIAYREMNGGLKSIYSPYPPETFRILYEELKPLFDLGNLAQATAHFDLNLATDSFDLNT
jgi:hypothetical protein